MKDAGLFVIYHSNRDCFLAASMGRYVDEPFYYTHYQVIMVLEHINNLNELCVIETEHPDIPLNYINAMTVIEFTGECNRG